MKYKLEISNLKKIFQNKNGKDLEAIKDISFEVTPGEIVSIVGTSGCGKSTLLNIIANLETSTSGTIKFDSTTPKISYMLQSDALLPWKNILDNACLGLELRHTKTPTAVEKVKKLLKEYGLGDFMDKKPSCLSGGMKQRVALIRSLAIEPDILLLDEPFSALDYYTRLTISKDVHDIIKDNNTTAIMITHDIAEALSLSDRIIVLSSRPSIVKNIYTVNLPQTKTIIEKRALKEFNELYDKIWRDLDA